MKIVLIASFLYPLLGGPEKLVFHLANEYSRLGHDVYVMTYVGGEKDFYSKYKFKVIFLPFLKTRKLKYTMRHVFSPFIIKDLISIKPDIIHIHDTSFAFSSMVYKKLFHNCPVVLSSHCIFDEQSPLLYRMLFGLDLKFADMVALEGTQMREDVKRMYGIESTLVSLCLDTGKYKKRPKNEILKVKRRYGIPLNKKVILTVGRIAEQKNLELTLHSISEVVKNDKNIFYVMTGGGDKAYINSLIELIKRLNIENHVKMIGPIVSEDDLTAVYSMADLFLTTTLWETISISAIEALSCSIPVVSTNAGSMRDIIINGYNGFLVDKREPKEIAEKVLLALRNKKRFSLNARKLVEKNLSTDVVSKQYIELYKKLIHKSRIR